MELSPQSLNLEAVVGSAQNPRQAVSLTTVGEASMSWSARVATSVGGAWLSVLPNSGIGQATLTVTAAVGNLPPGTYTGRITVTAPEANNSPMIVTVNLNVSRPIPTLTLGSSALTFSTFEGVAPPSQALTIADPSGSSYSWTARAATTSGGNWLQPVSTSGAGNATLQVSVDPAGLRPGTYAGAITVTGSGLARSPQSVQVTLNVTPRPVLVVGASALAFFVRPGQDSPPQSLAVSNSGGSSLNWTAVPATGSGGNWLAVNPASGTGNATVQVSVRAAALAEGSYSGTVTIAGAGAANSPSVVQVSLTVGLPVLLSRDGIVNAGSFARNQAVTANEILSLFGSNFTDPCSLEASGTNPPCPRAQGFPLPAQLGATQVTFNGIVAPLLLATPGQINLVTPFGLSGSTVTVVVKRGAVVGPAITLPLAEQAIGFFTVLNVGAGAGIVLHADGRLVTRDSPLEAGEIVILYLTGLGDVSPATPAGAAAPSSPLARTTVPMRVFFDGGEGRILFSGLAPGLAGAYQMNVETPNFLARRYPIVRVQSATFISNDVSAGGPSIFHITPDTAKAGVDLAVTLRGLNFPLGAALQVGGENIPVTLSDGPLQTLSATLPGRLLRAGDMSIAVVHPAAPAEAASNPVRLVVAP